MVAWKYQIEKIHFLNIKTEGLPKFWGPPLKISNFFKILNFSENMFWHHPLTKILGAPIKNFKNYNFFQNNLQLIFSFFQKPYVVGVSCHNCGGAPKSVGLCITCASNPHCRHCGRWLPQSFFELGSTRCRPCVRKLSSATRTSCEGVVEEFDIPVTSSPNLDQFLLNQADLIHHHIGNSLARHT